MRPIYGFNESEKTMYNFQLDSTVYFLWLIYSTGIDKSYVVCGHWRPLLCFGSFEPPMGRCEFSFLYFYHKENDKLGVSNKILLCTH